MLEAETARLTASRSSQSTSLADLPLLDFVPTVTPKMRRPVHLGALTDAFDRAERGETVRALFTYPPQHGKSTTVFHGLARCLLRRAIPILYLTYSIDFAFRQMRLARQVALDAGVKIKSTSRSICDWQTEGGGSLWATGVGGPINGNPGKLILLDDLIQNWKAAQSVAIRDATEFCVRSDIVSRCHPDTSIIGINTRWHEDDVVGRLSRDGWEVYNFPAIDDEGNALWEDERPVAWLEEQRRSTTAHVFEALYQGRPRPRGGTVFEGVHYGTPPAAAFQVAIGVDLAYSEKTHADASVSIVLARESGTDNVYVLDCVRKQVRAPEFGLTLKSHASRYPGSPMRWYAAGTEKGVADFLFSHGVNIDAVQPAGGKLVRAQPVAAAWNAGKILVPTDAPWLDTLLSEVLSFTGVSDAHDDQVDALAAAFDALGSGVTARVAETGGRRASASLRKGHFY